MDDSVKHIPFYERGPGYQLLVSLMLILSVGFVLTVITLGAGVFIFGSDIKVFSDPSLATTSTDIAFLKFALMSQTICFFVIPAIILFKKIKPGDQRVYPEFRLPAWKEVFLVIVVAFCLFPVTALTGEINSGLHLPDAFSGLEDWIRKSEDDAMKLIDQVLSPVAVPGLLLNIIMIAVLPAVGEEMIFRGVLQKIFTRIFKSGHVSVWITAFLFSALHLQFLGFIPRFLLGLVFGYLFLFSGKLWLSILAHFVNNAVPTVLSFIYGFDDLLKPVYYELWKQAIAVPLPLFIIVLILLNLRETNKAQLTENIEKQEV
jgi:membrane protease YdiL (CAAX protease family)